MTTMTMTASYTRNEMENLRTQFFSLQPHFFYGEALQNVDCLLVAYSFHDANLYRSDWKILLVKLLLKKGCLSVWLMSYISLQKQIIVTFSKKNTMSNIASEMGICYISSNLLHILKGDSVNECCSESLKSKMLVFL